MNNIFLFIIFIIYIGVESIIVFPFEMSRPNKNSKDNYTFEDFFLDNILIDFYTTIHIGNQNIKALGRISTINHNLIFSEEECNRKSLEQSFDYSLVTKRGYPLYQSLSYKNISKIDNYLIISEIFNLFNTTYQSSIPPSLPTGNFLKQQYLIDSKITINDMKIMLEDNNRNSNNNKYCILIGLNSPYSKNKNIDEIFLINELKRLGIINDYSWTFNFYSSGAGQLIIGGLPHEYMNETEYYQKRKLIKIKSSSVDDYNLPWSISFNQIYFNNDKNEKIFLQKNIKSFLVPNLGFIIGSFDYKKYILQNYFNFFFEDNICKIEKVENNNISNIINNNDIFELFICESKSFEKKKIFKNFPHLYFVQSDTLNYTFVLNYFDLFTKINDKYYFLIIFPEKFSEKTKQNWYLGFPFHKNYQFIFNYDTKTIGIYSYTGEYEYEEMQKTKPIEIGDTKINTNLKGYSYKRIIIEIIICIFLIIIAFFIGKKINKERKRKANELRDDNYEYFSSVINSNIKNNDINIKSNYNEIKMNTNNKLLEMSSKIN